MGDTDFGLYIYLFLCLATEMQYGGDVNLDSII
jgi:hypothetical protein